ncbi:hypothetical protein DFJ63DRAFT_235485 [Scheffersomyces coipomensis]|uniref:uncharacterized protein n=1 Tax=Scheffersomyces coipomensis TaxID=1788519 RepID=UPI00315DB264
MIELLDLPPEILLCIFQSFSASELDEFILRMIKLFDTDDNRLLDLMYIALFSKTLLITNDNIAEKVPDIYRQLPINDFEILLLLQRHKSTLFQQCQPQKISIRFLRKSDDYHRFIRDLQQLHYSLKRKKKGTTEQGNLDQLVVYFETRFKAFDVYIDCNLQMVENPTSISSGLIQVLLDLAENPYLIAKLKKLTLIASDIGTFYVKSWSQLFHRFENLIELNLSNNVIQNTYDEVEDVFSTSFNFPPLLKSLDLSQNLITNISVGFIKNLPRSLVVLKLNDNIIVHLGDTLKISKRLPNLRNLQLNNNPHLDYINETTFMDITNKDFLLELRGNNINNDDMVKLKNMARLGKFTLDI